MRARIGGFARLVLGVVFLVAAAGKLSDLHGFAGTISRFGLFPPFSVFPLALAIASGEALLGLFLLSGLLPRFSGLCASTALVVMTALYVPEILAGADAGECHCFGALMPMTIGPLFLLRNSALIALAVLVVIWDDGALSLMRWFTRGTPHADIRP